MHAYIYTNIPTFIQTYKHAYAEALTHATTQSYTRIHLELLIGTLQELYLLGVLALFGLAPLRLALFDLIWKHVRERI